MLVDDLQIGPLVRPIDGGYAVNIDASLMVAALEQYRVEPSRPARVFAGDIPTAIIPMTPDGRPDLHRMSEIRASYSTVFLVFPDRAAALASSIGPYL